jgi:regulator of extracellular matrix RemA (YlzA/DUF370 family)
LYKIIEARDLIQKQNKLDKLKQEAKDRDQLKQETKGKDQKKVLLVPTPTQVFMGVVYKEKQAELIRLQNMLDQVSQKTITAVKLFELTIFLFR